MAGLITLTQAAERKGCSRQWIYYLITKKRLKAMKIGSVFVLNPEDVDSCDVRPRAKPKKARAKKNGKNGHKKAGK